MSLGGRSSLDEPRGNDERSPKQCEPTGPYACLVGQTLASIVTCCVPCREIAAGSHSSPHRAGMVLLVAHVGRALMRRSLGGLVRRSG